MLLAGGSLLAFVSAQLRARSTFTPPGFVTMIT
jgi:hypothetical protein